MSKRYVPPEFSRGAPGGKIAARIARAQRVAATQERRRSGGYGVHADGTHRCRQRGQARRAAIATSSREG